MQIEKALLYKYGDKKWSLKGSSYEGLLWNDTGVEKPTEDELSEIWNSQEFNEGMKELEAVEKRKEKILASWPFHDQFEALTEASMGRPERLDELKNFIISVKEEFPKD